MTGKFLGKIDYAQYGTLPDYPWLIGVHLGFRLGNGCEICDGAKYTVNISKNCNWESDYERAMAVLCSIEKVDQILKDAKCNYISQLVNKPVEVEIEDNTFKNFRILTEVL